MRPIDRSAGPNDLDNWVDNVFDPVIDSASNRGLTTPMGLLDSLRGNGSPDQHQVSFCSSSTMDHDHMLL